MEMQPWQTVLQATVDMRRYACRVMVAAQDSIMQPNVALYERGKELHAVADKIARPLRKTA